MSVIYGHVGAEKGKVVQGKIELEIEGLRKEFWQVTNFVYLGWNYDIDLHGEDFKSSARDYFHLLRIQLLPRGIGNCPVLLSIPIDL